MVVVTVLVFSGEVNGIISPTTGPSLARPVGNAGLPAAPSPQTSSLPAFPNNLTHFIYVVRENHVFDDYLGDCHTTINSSCNDNTDYSSQTNYQADVPFLHDLARNYTVFDNMYSSIDPYSSQGHAYLLTADASGTDLCATGGVEGTGSSSEWGVYNSSSVQSGYCSFLSDGNDENYPSGGSIFDRFLGPNVTQTDGTPSFLTIGDIIWNVASPGCSVASTTGIPGSLPGNSQAVEHLTGCTNGWWYNSSTSSATMPPVVNPVTGVPEELFVCQDYCKTGPSPYLDQDSAYAFISYVKDYGLPTYTYVRLGDDHPGSLCGSSEPYSTCIQWNDASLKLIVQDILNSTSPYANNTVIAISEDDTQNGQNGPDHINNGRRLPFVLVASHRVMRSGASNPASCGIAASYGHCGLVIHPTYNTSNVLAVMERVEMNVNPSVFYTGGTSPNRFAFPMEQNDYLAELDPLEPVWKCGEPGVPCNTGVISQVLTSTAVSPNPVNAAAGSAVGLTASALDQNGRAISGASFTWNLNPTSLGTLSPTTGSTVTFTAASTAGTGTVCENATYHAVTQMGCASVTVSTTVTLASVALAPPGPVSVLPSHPLNFTASSAGSNGQPLTGSTTFAWTVNTTAYGALNASTGSSVTFNAGASNGNLTLCVNGTYAGVTRMACDAVSVSQAAPALTSVTLTPLTVSLPSGGVQTFDAQAMDQYSHPITSGITYQWTVSPASLGTVTPASGTSNTTTFTAATTSTGATGTLTVSAINALTTLVTRTASVTVQPQTGPPTISSFTALPATLALGGTTFLNVSVTGGTGTLTYSYTGLPSPCASQDLARITCPAGAAGTYSVTVTVSDSASPPRTATATIGFTVFTPPSIASFTASPATIAPGGTTTLTVTATGGLGPLSYGYSGLPSPCASANQSSITCSTTASGTYPVTVTVSDSAATPHTATNTTSFTVQTATSPLTLQYFYASPSTFTVGKTTTLSTNVTGGTAPYTYAYQGLPKGCSSANSATLTCTPTETGAFNVTLQVTDRGGQHTGSYVVLTVQSAPAGPNTTTGGGSSSSLELYLVIGIVAVAALAAVAIVLARRRRSPPQPAQAPQPQPPSPATPEWSEGH